MTEKPLNELIDDYAAGRITPEEKIFLEELAAADPEVASKIHTAKVAYAFVERVYYKSIKEKLKTYDRSIETKADPPSKNKLSPLMIAGIIMVALLWMIAYWYNRPVNLAKRFFYPLSEELVRARSGDATAILWMQAYEDYQKNNFTDAEKIYHQLSADPDNALQPYIHWNILLCRLAEDGVSVEWRYQLDEYIAFADGPVKEKAIRMRTHLNSWIYKLSRFQFSPEFSSLKPRLI